MMIVGADTGPAPTSFATNLFLGVCNTPLQIPPLTSIIQIPIYPTKVKGKKC